MRPESMISTLSARVSTSITSWVTRTADRPRSVSVCRNSFRIADAVETSRPASGSSSRRTSGSAARARARATRWACPPDSCLGIRSARSPASTWLQPVRGRCASLPSAAPAMAAARRERHIGRDTQMREQQRVLQQHADPPRMGRHEDASRGIGERSVAEPYHSRIRAHQTRDHVKCRRFTRAVGAEDGEHFTCGGGEFDVDAAVGDDGIAHAYRSRRTSRHRRTGAQRPGSEAEHDDGGDRDQQHRKRDGGVGVGLALEIDLQRQRPGDTLS